MTPAELDQLRDLAQAATPGPWRVEAQGNASQARAAVGEEGEHCMRTSSDPDTRRRVPSGAEMRAVADALGNLGTKTRGR